MKYLIISVIGILSANFTALVSAHSEDNAIKTQVVGYAAFTWRSNEINASDEPYLIPGTLLGGEALAHDKGASIDEIRLAGIYDASEDYYLTASVTSHHDDEISVESFSLVAPQIAALGNASIELGKFDSNVSPTAYWHSTSGDFNEPSLLSDVFFGRHFVDKGARVVKKFKRIQFGVEGFRGDSWPANNGEGSASVFVHSGFELGDTHFSLNAWAMASDSFNRFDDRYSNGHNHGGNEITSSTEEYRFTGDTNHYGLWLTQASKLNALIISTELEWIMSKSDGTLANTTQQSFYENHYEGYRIYLGASLHKHRISFQHEEIALQNDFLSPIPVNFAENANLVNNDFEPNKSVFTWSYSIHQDVRLRIEYASLKIKSPERQARTSIGILWKKPLL